MAIAERAGLAHRISPALVLRVRERLDGVLDNAGGNLRDIPVRIQRTLGITRAGQAVLVTAAVLWVAARVVAGPVIYLAAYGAFLMLVVAYALAPRRAAITGERRGLHPRARAGQHLEVELTVVAKRRFATVVLEEVLPPSLGSPVLIPVSSMSRGQEVVHTYTLPCNRRGVYQVGPLVARIGDPFGLVRRETVVAPAFELVVHPAIEPADDRPLTRQFEDPPLRPPVSRPWPSGLEFYGMRAYTPGDDLRRIVWRATARTGVVMVREAEQGITDRITLVLDTNRSGHSAPVAGVSDSFETAVRVIASLGVRHLRIGYEVRTEVNDAPLTRPLRGAGRQLTLLDGLARLQMHRTPFAQVVERLIADPRRDAHMVMVTPHLTEHDAARLRLLLRTGVSVSIVALAWDDEQGDVVGRAAALGCQVVALRPGQDIGAALVHGIGAGTR